MKKKLLAISLALVLLAAFTGCGGTNAPTAASPSAGQENMAAAETPQMQTPEPGEMESPAPESVPEPEETPAQSEGAEIADADYAAVYQDTLEDLHRLIAHPDTGLWEEDDGLLAVIEAANDSEDALGSIGYAFEDLSGDGFCELLVGSTSVAPDMPGNRLYAVYTRSGEATVCTFGGGARFPHYLTNDGSILYYASNGASSYGFGRSEFSASGAELVCRELTYVGIGPDGETISVFENGDGRWDEDSAYLSDMTPEDFDEAWRRQAADTRYVELTPFILTAYPDGFAGAEGVPPVYASYADRDTLAECEQYVLDDDDYAVWVYLYANETVEHFYVQALKQIEVREDGSLSYITEELAGYDPLLQGTGLALKMDLPETLPSYAVSYFTENGSFHSFAIMVSGQDGSIELMELDG